MSYWRSIITESYNTGISEDVSPVFRDPVDPLIIERAEQQLHVKLPEALITLYQESNGVINNLNYKGKDIETGYFLWPLERVITENLHLRSWSEFKNMYMPFENLLFFADAGNGDLFAFVILNGSIWKQDVFSWNHEDDSRNWVAPSLQTFIDWRRKGKITT